MDEIRYPLGPFQVAEHSTPELRINWIQDIKGLPASLRLHVHNLSQDQLRTPYRLGGWTVAQVVHHIADNDMNASIRFKRALTEDNPVAGTYREDLWAELSDSGATSIELSLTMIEALRSRFALLLESMNPVDFNRTFISPTHGLMNLDHAAQRFAWHGRHHLAQIISLKQRLEW